MEVTVGHPALMTAAAATPVARGFAVTGCPFGGPKSTLRLPAGAKTRLLTAFDYTHERPRAGSVEGSTASFRGGKGAQPWVTQSVLKHSASILKQVYPAAMLPNWNNYVVRRQCCASNSSKQPNQTVARAPRAMFINSKPALTRWRPAIPN